MIPRLCIWSSAWPVRGVVAWKLSLGQPTAEQVCELLDAALAVAGRAPRYIVSDRGVQFQRAYLAWCKRYRVKPRYGAVGKHGSIAVLERFWRSLKSEMLRRLVILPLPMPRMDDKVAAYVAWYQEHRPHQGLGGRTPREVRRGEKPRRERTPSEPRARYPLARGDPKRNRRRVTRLILDARNRPVMDVVIG